MRKFLIVISLAAVIAAISATDYCSSTLCIIGPHIACGHNGQFSSNCPHDVAMVPMTDSLKQLIVDGHNAKRNFIAGGGDVNHKPACRMATMQWDDELAYLASLNVKQCDMKHDTCRNTDQFRFAGQNIAWIPFRGPIDNEARFNEAIELWYSEVANSKQEYIDSFPVEQLYSIGHFTAMMTDRNIRVGCAATTYYTSSESIFKTFLVACNYASGNLPNVPIYVKCDRPAKECSTGNNPSYPNLCSVNEHFDANYGYN
ncbi:antigen 5 like allergen Cul n 1-like [Lucilia sericata]|uniref:antigen 5 like allergen Cul n 1-like n=1 Tax=Lucilia sericata TaxID=13632 RepID=UPI0018A8410B|nr:antigen 5 like allergen Cul n 1-like [Lucilia sericata]